MKIAPQMSQEFIIVVKAPKNRLQARIVSFIDIQLNDDIQQMQQSSDQGMKKAIEKHLDHKKQEIVQK